MENKVKLWYARLKKSNPYIERKNLMANKQPNILIFMADHYRGDMAPPFGRCLTPNLDSIYNDGSLLTNYTPLLIVVHQTTFHTDCIQQSMVYGTM